MRASARAKVLENQGDDSAEECTGRFCFFSNVTRRMGKEQHIGLSNQFTDGDPHPSKALSGVTVLFSRNKYFTFEGRIQHFF